MPKSRRTLVESVATSLSVPSQQTTMFLGIGGLSVRRHLRLAEHLIPYGPDSGGNERLAVEVDLLDLEAGVVFKLQVGSHVHPANPPVGRADHEHDGVLPVPPVFDVTLVLDDKDFRPVLSRLDVRSPG